METKWTEAIHKTPPPEPATLTERALAQASRSARRGLHPAAYGSLALAATLPVAFLLLPKPSTPPEPDPPVALRFAKQSLNLEKRQSEEVRAVLQPKIALSQHQPTPLPKQNTALGLSLSVTPNKEKATLPRSRPLAESKTTTYEFQERAVLKESAQANEELLLRLARGGVALRGLSVSSLSSSSNARGTQVGLAVSERLAEIEGTLLTPLPNAPTYENPKLKTTLMRQPNGNVEGTLVLANNTKERGALPKVYLVYVAAFDAKGTLISTTQTELPGAGGTATVKLGLAPTAQHYQLALFAKPSPPKDEMMIAGYVERLLAGEVPPPLTGTYGGSTFNLVTPYEPHFYQSNYYKTVSANLTVSVASMSDAAGYTVHGALFDEKGALLSTDQAPLKPLTLTTGTPLQAQHSQTIGLGFGVTSQNATRYQLAITAPKPTLPNSRLGERLVALATLTPQAVQTEHSLALSSQNARGGIVHWQKPLVPLPVPLSPLTGVPQLLVKKAKLELDDAMRISGSVTLAPEELPRELLVVVCDGKGTLRGTTSELIPAGVESVTIRPFASPSQGANHYQLATRLRPEPVAREIVGGYTGHTEQVTVPAPEGVTLSQAEFFRSNAYQDSFVRFYATLSQKLTDAPAGRSLTLHGVVFDSKGALISIASAPLKIKTREQRLDLEFGVLPESNAHRYQFVVTTTTTPLSPQANLVVASVKTEEDGSLVLLPPPSQHPMDEIFKKPELRDYTQVKLAPSVVAALKAKGITEFVGKSIQASGKSESSLYLAYPAFKVTTVTVEKAEDVQVRLPITLTAPEPSQTLKRCEARS